MTTTEDRKPERPQPTLQSICFELAAKRICAEYEKWVKDGCPYKR